MANWTGWTCAALAAGAVLAALSVPALTPRSGPPAALPTAVDEPVSVAAVTVESDPVTEELSVEPPEPAEPRRPVTATLPAPPAHQPHVWYGDPRSTLPRLIDRKIGELSVSAEAARSQITIPELRERFDAEVAQPLAQIVSQRGSGRRPDTPHWVFGRLELEVDELVLAALDARAYVRTGIGPGSVSLKSRGWDDLDGFNGFLFDVEVLRREVAGTPLEARLRCEALEPVAPLVALIMQARWAYGSTAPGLGFVENEERIAADADRVYRRTLEARALVAAERRLTESSSRTRPESWSAKNLGASRDRFVTELEALPEPLLAYHREMLQREVLAPTRALRARDFSGW